tara:strand:- start:3884 stop:4153 length:270 start_codon:yes stop_codon:yes gene_type:complete
MAIKNIKIIDKKHQHLISIVADEDDAIGVWLKKPYIFSVSNASCTFFDLNSPDYEDLSWSKARQQAIEDLNECIANEAEKIDPTEWDNG